MPIVGLGTWITFNVGGDPVLRDECASVMAAFFEAGGRMIDSSPMYGSSQPVIGYGLQKLGRPSTLFSAEKVWTSSAAAGPTQIDAIAVQRPDAVLVIPDAATLDLGVRIAALQLQHRIPVVSTDSDLTSAGGLISWLFAA